ncbi:hypothetical protein SUDANB1_03255 [Streptomyces sp. enrichment culture]
MCRDRRAPTWIRWDAPGTGSYVLIAASAGHQPQASTIVVTGEPLAYDVLLTGTRCLAGVVRSADGGTPVADAVVIMTDVRGEVRATERTDVLGEFTVTRLVPGPVTFAASSPKHRPLAQVVEIGGAGTTRVELELRPGARVRGTVCGGGAPLSDALVTLVDAAGNVVATTRTGVDGGVRLLRPGLRRVHGHRDRLPAPGGTADGPGRGGTADGPGRGRG